MLLHRSKELLLFLEQGRINVLCLLEGTDHGMVLYLAIGLHNKRGHSWTYIDTGTQVFAKYHGVVWEGDPVIPELNPIPKVNSQNGQMLAVSPKTTVSGTCPSNL